MFVFTLSASMRQNSPILLFFLWMYGIICLFSANLIMCTCGMQRSSGGDRRSRPMNTESRDVKAGLRA
jgi:hypothetical protein